MTYIATTLHMYFRNCCKAFVWEFLPCYWKFAAFQLDFLSTGFSNFLLSTVDDAEIFKYLIFIKAIIFFNSSTIKKSFSTDSLLLFVKWKATTSKPTTHAVRHNHLQLRLGIQLHLVAPFLYLRVSQSPRCSRKRGADHEEGSDVAGVYMLRRVKDATKICAFRRFGFRRQPPNYRIRFRKQIPCALCRAFAGKLKSETCSGVRPQA